MTQALGLKEAAEQREEEGRSRARARAEAERLRVELEAKAQSERLEDIKFEKEIWVAEQKSEWHIKGEMEHAEGIKLLEATLAEQGRVLAEFHPPLPRLPAATPRTR